MHGMEKRHDTLIFREILEVNSFLEKTKTTQLTQFWQGIAINLTGMEDPKFKNTISNRSVQDRCFLLCDKYKKRMNFKKRASGISTELTELDVLIEEFDDRERRSQRGNKAGTRLNISNFSGYL
jgi:hypothetical protein